jgi:hypothetical protein
MKKYLFSGIVAFIILLPLWIIAQPVANPAVATTIDPFSNVDVSLENVVNLIWKTFASAWYLGIALVLYLLVNFIRGKLKIFGWIVKIPKFTDWLEGKGKLWRSIFIVGFVALGSAFGALATVSSWTLWPIIKAMFGGLIAGAQMALSAMGINSLVANTKPGDTPTVTPGPPKPNP